MKKIIFVLLICLILPVNTFAFNNNELIGIHYIYYGDTLQNVQKYYNVTYGEYVPIDNSVTYKGYMYGIDLDKTYALKGPCDFWFWNNQLYMFGFTAAIYDNQVYYDLKKSFSFYLGNPDYDSDENNVKLVSWKYGKEEYPNEVILMYLIVDNQKFINIIYHSSSLQYQITQEHNNK